MIVSEARENGGFSGFRILGNPGNPMGIQGIRNPSFSPCPERFKENERAFLEIFSSQNKQSLITRGHNS
jgi:hypothetical protein